MGPDGPTAQAVYKGAKDRCLLSQSKYARQQGRLWTKIVQLQLDMLSRQISEVL